MKYSKKPIEIEAEQFFPEKKPWPAGVYKVGGVLPGEEGSDLWFRIDTLEGEYRVTRGDWIVTGIKGEKYPCKPDIFEATYEPVEEPCSECATIKAEGGFGPSHDGSAACKSGSIRSGGNRAHCTCDTCF